MTPTCQCRLDPTDDRTELSDLCSEASGAYNGVGWKIVWCPRHAAAPELLKALKGLMGKLGRDFESHLAAEKVAARTAIDKAEKP